MAERISGIVIRNVEFAILYSLMNYLEDQNGDERDLDIAFYKNLSLDERESIKKGKKKIHIRNKWYQFYKVLWAKDGWMTGAQIAETWTKEKLGIKLEEGIIPERIKKLVNNHLILRDASIWYTGLNFKSKKRKIMYKLNPKKFLELYVIFYEYKSGKHFNEFIDSQYFEKKYDCFFNDKYNRIMLSFSRKVDELKNLGIGGRQINYSIGIERKIMDRNPKNGYVRDDAFIHGDQTFFSTFNENLDLFYYYAKNPPNFKLCVEFFIKYFCDKGFDPAHLKVLLDLSLKFTNSFRNKLENVDSNPHLDEIYKNYKMLFKYFLLDYLKDEKCQWVSEEFKFLLKYGTHIYPFIINRKEEFYKVINTQHNKNIFGKDYLKELEQYLEKYKDIKYVEE